VPIKEYGSKADGPCRQVVINEPIADVPCRVWRNASPIEGDPEDGRMRFLNTDQTRVDHDVKVRCQPKVGEFLIKATVGVGKSANAYAPKREFLKDSFGRRVNLAIEIVSRETG